MTEPYMLDPGGDGWSQSFPYSRVLVTGGAGFLGSYVVERLKRRGVENITVPRSAEYDLRDLGDVHRLFIETEPDCVIHLAATCGGIGANQANPASYYYDNLIMGANVMDQARKFSVKKFVAIGSVCAYPKHTPVPFKEVDLWNGYPEETNAPYGLAKKMLLVQAQAYRQQYGFNAIYLLPANLYGPRDNFDLETSHVIPALIRKCVEAKGDQVVCWGSGAPTREFLHADDCARGIVLATEKYDGAEPVNLGTGVETSMLDLARKIGDLSGFKGQFVWDISKPDRQPRRCLSTTRAEREFGFSARISLDAGLKQTIEWYGDNLR